LGDFLPIGLLLKAFLINEIAQNTAEFGLHFTKAIFNFFASLISFKIWFVKGVFGHQKRI
jgi:hypothetical protein